MYGPIDTAPKIFSPMDRIPVVEQRAARRQADGDVYAWGTGFRAETGSDGMPVPPGADLSFFCLFSRARD